MTRKRTTSEVAPEMGISPKVLINYLGRHPELKPGERLPNGDFLWGANEIKRLKEARSKRRTITKQD